MSNSNSLGDYPPVTKKESSTNTPHEYIFKDFKLNTNSYSGRAKGKVG